MSPSRRTRVVAALTIVAGLLVPFAQAHAQYFGRNKVQYESFDFKRLQTEHFDIYYYPDEKVEAEQAARMAERWYARLARVFEGDLHGRQPLILYASHPDFEQTNAIPGTLDETTGGVTESSKRRIVLPLAASLAETDHVIGHELVHAFQYDLRRGGEANPFDNGSQLPLWFIEGMAEYFSLGPHDPNTAMWLRDAVRSQKLPTIAKLDNPRYFPYRFGQAFWAYIAAKHGDSAVAQAMKAGSMRGAQAGPVVAATLGASADSLSRDWQESIQAWAKPIIDARAKDPGRALIVPQGDRGRMNVGPSLSPDGSRLAFLSERDQFSIELYVADARTGKVLRRLTRTAMDPHLQSLQFIYSAGDWSPDGRRIALATVSRGKPGISILDASSGHTLHEYQLPTLGEIFSPSWSPDAKHLAFSATYHGNTNLYTVDLASKRLTQLTGDLFSDQHPAWSPDGKSLVFVTDRYTTDLDSLTFGSPRLALIDLASKSIHEVPGTGGGKCIDPHWSPDGESIYFLSDQTGITNVYRLHLEGGELQQVTDVATGVSGITAMSPALSVARRSGAMAFSIYENMGYQIRRLETTELAGTTPQSDAQAAVIGSIPPPRTNVEPASSGRDSITAQSHAPLPDVSTFKSMPYHAGLSLDRAVQVGIGASGGSGGTGLSGGSAFYWSDMLGNHNLTTLVNLSGSIGGVSKSLGLFGDYENRRQRWAWGLEGYQIPYFSRDFVTMQDPLTGIVQVQDQRSWQVERAMMGSVTYPVSPVMRFEGTAGYRNIDFSGEVETLTYDPNGFLIDDTTTPSPDEALPSLSLYTSSLAAVFDNSIFGGTSPVAGQRYRLEVAPMVGDLQFATVLGDFRRYFRLVGPFSLATRAMHIGRYGRDSESNRIGSLFVGYPWLIRGYDAESFTPQECQTGDCAEFQRLFGSRIGIANVELRMPLLGAIGLIRSPQIPPVEIAGFYDAGAAWTSLQKASFLGGVVPGVTSMGGAFRINMLGFAVAEIAYVHPNDRPLKGWYWQFDIQPGF